MFVFEIKQQKLCEWLWENKDTGKTRIDILLDNIKIEYNFETFILNELGKKLKNTFLTKYNLYWNSASRKKHYFIKKHQEFLNNYFRVTININSPSISSSKALRNSSVDLSRKRGRPRIETDAVSSKTKKRRITDLKKNVSEELLVAACSTLSVSNDFENEAANESECDQIALGDKSLAMFMDLDLSKDKYMKLRKHNEVMCNNKIYPPYPKIVQAKKFCYPELIFSTDRKAWVDLQSLLDHTASRLLSNMQLEILYEFFGENLIFDIKWGMDGSSSQQTIKQKWDSNDSSKCLNNEQSDESVFQISLVPLKLGTESKTLWKNNRPSSVRFCRPIELEFIKETPENTLEKYNYYNKIIQELQHFKFKVDRRFINITYNLKCTMIDGKTCNYLAGQSSSTSCNICGAKPSEMNDIDYVRSLSTKDEYYNLGLHPLHCRINFMLHLWHVACNLDFQCYYASGDNKIVQAARKILLQNSIKSNLGIKIDVVKQGYGTTNDGNTSRRFFKSPEVLSDLIGIDINLIKRYCTILQVINSGYEVDIIKLKKYAYETAELYVKLYDWYPMPPTVHKVLLHGWKIIESLGLPIGSLSEEALEANNKIFKRSRSDHSRMCSRQKSNEDVLHHLLISSDPHISQLRIEKEKESQELSEEAKKLLIINNK